MTYLNEYEAAEAERIVRDADLPNLSKGAEILGHLIDWTNSCSDGWVYWRKPRQAAQKLVTMLEDRRREWLCGHVLTDCTDQELRQALVPIKTLLTKQGVDYRSELPWAAIIPDPATL